MKQILLGCTIVSLLSVVNVRADFIEDAIAESDTTTLKVLVANAKSLQTPQTISSAQKEHYVALAQEKANEAQAIVDDSHFSSRSLQAVDWLGLSAAAVLSISGVIATYDCFFKATEKDDDEAKKVKHIKWFKDMSGKGLTLYFLGGALKSIKDFIKTSTDHRSKDVTALKDAKKVLSLVKELPVKGHKSAKEVKEATAS